MGVLSYLAFGSSVQPIVLLNLPSTSPLLQVVQLAYILAILLSVPITLFPAIRIVENGVFSTTRSGKDRARWKWAKNAFRSVLVAVCAALSWVGTRDLDKFVAFVGCFAAWVSLFPLDAISFPNG
jgi:solute carrier family 36 (proton-coupled amino acid transporter)